MSKTAFYFALKNETNDGRWFLALILTTGDEIQNFKLVLMLGEEDRMNLYG